MCSIFGCIGENYKKVAPIFSQELSHRGPDGKGVYFDETKKLVLGHTRLSIIDLSNSANQPMSDTDNNLQISFNGEIYNYQEIKNQLIPLGYRFRTNSDTEVVLKSYIQWGKECVNKFRGMFAFCIYDKQKKYLFLARDRFGIKPLIYSFLENHFFFSSELKPFLNLNFLPKSISQAALNEYFKYGSVQQPKTILEGIYHLMPGHNMTVTFEKNYQIDCYYNYVNESEKLPKIERYEDAIEKVREEFEIATKYHMVADVEIGAFLSGGVDSTAVVAMMRKYSNKKINTFSVGFKSKTHIQDETEIAARSAKRMGCYHHNIMIDDDYIKNLFENFINNIDQPSIDGINTYIVAYETAKKIKVALSGLGGDEIFAGYPHFKTISDYAQKKKGIVSFLGNKLDYFHSNRFTQKYIYTGIGEEQALVKQRTIHNNLREVLSNPLSISSNLKDQKLSPIQKISRSEIDKYMLNTLLRDNDVTSMAHSLEVRPVLLDHKLVELAFSLKDTFKVRNGNLKSVFIDSVKDIIPAEVWLRKKTGFEMPYSQWMNGPLNSYFKEVVRQEPASKFFTSCYLIDLKERVRAKKLKTKDWGVFVFLCWMGKFSLKFHDADTLSRTHNFMQNSNLWRCVQ